MADNIYVVESRRVNLCYVGRCGPLVIVSELPQLAFNYFFFCRFAWSTVNISITFLVNVTITFVVDVDYCAPLWLSPVSGSASASVSGISSCVPSEINDERRSRKMSSLPLL